MTKDKKPKAPIQTAPAGIAVWPHLNTADEYTTPQGVKKVEFKTKVKYTKEEATPLIAKCAPIMAEAKAMGASETAGKRDKKGKLIEIEENDLYTVEVDDTGNETGFVIFSFSSKNKPAIFDASGKPINADVWGGTKLKVAYSTLPYYIAATNKYGVKLYLSAVQIIDLVTKGSRQSGDAGRYGFGKEDGYVQSEEGEVDAPSEVASSANAGEF